MLWCYVASAVLVLERFTAVNCGDFGRPMWQMKSAPWMLWPVTTESGGRVQESETLSVCSAMCFRCMKQIVRQSPWPCVLVLKLSVQSVWEGKLIVVECSELQSQSPSTGWQHCSSNHCHNWLHHRSWKTASFLLVLNWQQVCDSQFKLYQAFITTHAAYASTSKSKIVWIETELFSARGGYA